MMKSSINLRQVLLLTCLVFVGYLFSTLPARSQTSAIDSGFNPQVWLKNALEWIASLGSIGALAYIGIYIIATVAFLPAFILTLGAGVLFGVWVGSVYVFIGATLGSIVAFLVGRYLARNWVAKKIAGNNKFQAIDRAVSKEGLKIVLLTRLSPIFPFNLLNYAFGVTGVTMRDYIIGAIGMIPGTIMFVYLGSLAGNLALIGTETPPTNPPLQWTIRIVGLLATIVATVYVTRIAKQALDNLTVES
nr:TVP38/TMEM64 family protein [Chamaesiphon minutus]